MQRGLALNPDLSEPLFYIVPKMLNGKEKQGRREGRKEEGRQARWTKAHVDRWMDGCKDG